MTDKELIKQEIERRYNCERCYPLDREANVAAAVLQELLLFIDSLPEEPVVKGITWKDVNTLDTLIDQVRHEFPNGISEKSFGLAVLEKFQDYQDDIKEPPSEDLEEACDNYYDETWDEHGGIAMVVNNCHDIWFPSQATSDFFKAGAEWQRKKDRESGCEVNFTTKDEDLEEEVHKHLLNIGATIEMYSGNVMGLDLKRIIRLYSFTGDTVLDPFMGSGTTAIAAMKERRHFVGFELSKEYYDKAIKRIENEKAQLKLF